jgi:hypothetical protein
MEALSKADLARRHTGFTSGASAAVALAFVALTFAACSGGPSGTAGGAVNANGGHAGPTSDAPAAPDAGAAPDAPADTGGPAGNRYVFVIVMENRSRTQVVGSPSAPYFNGTLLPQYATSLSFVDELPGLPSEPRYIWLEAGTNVFADHTFTTWLPPTQQNSTASIAHLVTQMRTSGTVDWMSYQEDIGPATGACPIQDVGLYTAQHDPFLFFQDVAGAPPSANNPYCAAHHRPFTQLNADLTSSAIKNYNFIIPNLCHDMHGAPSCSQDPVRAGDDWLRATLPPLLTFVNANGGVVFIVWDEPGTLPFLAAGPNVKKGYASSVRVNHGSVLKTVERMLGLPILPAVAQTSDLADLFLPGQYP